MNSTRYVIADVFTSRRFGGNQLAVFPDAADLTSDTMQDIAREMNFSETTFLLPPERGGDFRVRIFTPARELPFAGHPIVGTAHVIVAESLKPSSDPVTSLTLETGVGLIGVDVESDNGRAGFTTMTQPTPVVRGQMQDRSRMAAALSLREEDLDPALPVEALYNGITVVITPLASIDALRRAKPDTGALSNISDELGAQTVLIFTTETVEPDSTAHCRVFAPSAGVVEDAATGSANGPFGVYLATHGLVDLDPLTRIRVEQGYEMNRPSTLHVELAAKPGTREVEAVRVAGDVVIAGRGDIYIA